MSSSSECGGSYTWGFWFRKRVAEQFDNENFNRTAFLISTGVFLGTWKITNRPDHAVIIAGFVGMIFVLYPIMRVKDPTRVVMTERKIVKTASEVVLREVEDVTEIDKLQELVNCRILVRAAFDACLVWGCGCEAESHLFSEEGIRENFKITVSQLEKEFEKRITESPKPVTDRAHFEKQYIVEKCRDEIPKEIRLTEIKKCPYCNEMGNFTLVKDKTMRTLIGLMKEGKWDEVQGFFAGASKFTPYINKEGETHYNQEKEEAPEGYRIHQPLLNLMKYVKEGGLLASEEISD